MLREEHEATINLFNDYSSIVSQVKYKVINGKGRVSDLDSPLKILTPRQMFQRLPIALAQVKTYT